MFSKLFHKKAIGLKFLGDSIKYALITFNNKKIIVNETQAFKLNCKTALHRLQHLLNKYPSVYVINSSDSLIKEGTEDVTSPKDRKQIVKNKVESLIENKKVFLNFQKNLKKSLAPLFIVDEELLNKHDNLLKKNGLKPQKIILSSESLLSLEHHFFSCCSKKALFYFAEDKVKLLFITQKRLTFFSSLQTKDRPLEEVVKKTLRLLYAHFDTLAELELHFHGLSPDLDKISQRLQSETGLNIKKSPYGSLEKEAGAFLVEVGAALSLVKEEPGGFQKESLTSLLKIYQKPLIANATLLVGLFILSYFYWGHKYSYIQNQNQILFQKSYSKLRKNEEFSAVADSHEQVADLNDLLKKKKKEVPAYLFQPNTFSVSDTLAWLSDISEELRTSESESPFVIESFKYSLISRPTKKKPTAPYRIKVSFSFSTNSSLTARMIHDIISKSKEVVDKGKNVSWNYQNNLYQISFYLKNRGFK